MSLRFRYVKELQRIINKYLKGNASAAEIDFLNSYYDYLDKEEVFFSGTNQSEQKQLEDVGFQSIKSKIASTSNKRSPFTVYRYAAAAAILVLIVGGTLYFLQPQQKPSPNQLITHKGKLDVLPGKSGATLTLADGSEIFLDEKKNEDVLKESGLTVSVNARGELIYQLERNDLAKENSFHKLSTAKGNQFQIVLSDGTKVWLNAMSSLRFPEIFGRRREVELVGEGYFEVAKDKSKPFLVKTQQAGIAQEVKVLGTKFNINSYLDEPVIKTSLVEGSVKVTNGKSTETLVPLMQAKLNHQKINTSEVDIEEVIAWKNGNFSFNNATLKSILDQMGRWYDIKIDQTNVPNKRYNGMISRNVNLSEILDMLSLTGNIKFELTKDRTLNITQNK